jgi:hypothetical protein
MLSKDKVEIWTKCLMAGAMEFSKANDRGDMEFRVRVLGMAIDRLKDELGMGDSSELEIIDLKRNFLSCKVYETNTGCTILCGIEPQGWHISISHKDRYPTWDEIKTVRYKLAPKDIAMSMIFPTEKDYVNIHENCFHLYELKT